MKDGALHLLNYLFNFGRGHDICRSREDVFIYFVRLYNLADTPLVTATTLLVANHDDLLLIRIAAVWCGWREIRPVNALVTGTARELLFERSNLNSVLDLVDDSSFLDVAASGG